MALASARNEINEQLENARLAAAKREALELIIVKMHTELTKFAWHLRFSGNASKTCDYLTKMLLQCQSEFIKLELTKA